MGKKMGCAHNPECPFVEMGRTCAHALFISGSCHRPKKSLPKGFLDDHSLHRDDNTGKMSGHAMQGFNKHHSSWRG